jgi:type IV pilus assembly protein PilA
MITLLTKGSCVVCVAASRAVGAMAGCGGSDSGGGGSNDSASARADDATAKSDARVAVTGLETCFVDTQTYAGCGAPAKFRSLSLHVKVVGPNSAPGEGELAVSKATQTGYVVTSKSKTGTDFKIEKTGNAQLKRTCTKPGSGGCGPGGTW